MAKQPTLAELIVDSSKLTDADWAEINKLQRTLQERGAKAMSQAIDELGDKDPVQCTRVMAAFFPDEIREIIKDVMADRGITLEDLLEMVRRHEAPPQKH